VSEKAEEAKKGDAKDDAQHPDHDAAANADLSGATDPPSAMSPDEEAEHDRSDSDAPEWSEPPPRDTMIAPAHEGIEHEETVNLAGDEFPLPGRDDFEDVTQTALPEELDPAAKGASDVSRAHLKGLLEALVFASDHPIKANELAKGASAPIKEVKDALAGLKEEYATRGVQLDEVAGGWIFRTSAQYAPFVRDLTKHKPVKLTRAQVETLAILAYRQPITRPEIDEIRGVDSGPVLKLLLERDLVRILGKKDEPGRPLLYGTTTHFLEFFGLKSVKDLPTLREFTELNEDSRRVVERELGETLESAQEVEASQNEGVVNAGESIGGESEANALPVDRMPGEESDPVYASTDTDPPPTNQTPAAEGESETAEVEKAEGDDEEEDDEYDDDLFDDDDDDDDDDDEDEDSDDEGEEESPEKE
jgi:segregation and condensation protein B